MRPTPSGSQDLPLADAAAGLQQIFAQYALPSAVLEDLLLLSQRFGPELLTTTTAFLSILLLNRGSRRKADLREGLSEQEQQAINIDATSQIALGSFGMAMVALAANNPLFARPEVINVLGSLTPYLAARFPPVKRVLEAVHADVLIKLGAIGVGVDTLARYAEHPGHTLPVAGLTALTIAFSGLREEWYRVMTLLGGSSFVAGSMVAGAEAIQSNNGVGAIMSAAFMSLNALFTWSEWNTVQKTGGLGSLLRKAGAALRDLFRKCPNKE